MESLLLAASILFQRLYTQPGETCPSGLERVGHASHAECAVYEHGFDRLKDTLKLYDDRPNRAVTTKRESEVGLPPSYHTSKIFTFHRAWRKQGNLHMRDWLEDGELSVIVYDEQNGLLALVPKDSCLEPDVRARDDLYFDCGEDFIKAGVQSSPSPPRPPKGPNGRVKEGDAVIQFVVDSHGAVRQACVLHARPGSFGKRALKTIRQWEFTSATIEDHPVDSIVSIAFRWRKGEWTHQRMKRGEHE